MHPGMKRMKMRKRREQLLKRYLVSGTQCPSNISKGPMTYITSQGDSESPFFRVGDQPRDLKRKFWELKDHPDGLVRQSEGLGS